METDIKIVAATIARQRDGWISAINRGSLDDFVGVVADDAVWLPSGRDAVHGKEEIRAWLAGPFRTYDYDYSVTEVRLRVAGNWAIEQASFTTVVSIAADEPPRSHDGSYIVLWNRYPGDLWLIDRYVDLSAPLTDVT